MKYAVNLNIVIDGNRIISSNIFYCDRSVLIPKVAKWVRDIKWDTGYRETRIESAIVNRDFDITNEVTEWQNPFSGHWMPF